MTNLLIRLFVKNSDDTKCAKTRYRFGLLGSIVGICCNLLLFTIKLIAGALSGSISIVADAFNNFSDMGSSVAALLGVKLASKPADKEHPFGHRRIEYMTAFIVAVLIVFVGFELFKSSIQKIFNPHPLHISALTFVILAVSVFIKFWMFLFNRKLSKKIDSCLLAATARDSINDVITTLAIMTGMAVQYFFEINLDPYISIAVAGFILYSGFCVSREALDPLLGTKPEQSLIDDIQNLILSFDAFEGMHDLIVHNYGPGRCFASVHVEVSQNKNIVYCHEQIDLCERLVSEKLSVELVIHLDPIDTENELLSTTKQKFEEMLKILNDGISIHDFRMSAKGKGCTNVIFDVVVPSDFDIEDSALIDKINRIAKQIDSTYQCVVNIDRNYL